MNSPYISRVKIHNFRNFIDVDVKLGHKQVIVGENNVGKTNFIRALQLILDPTLSDEDRMLEASDFNSSIENPMENGEEIRIDIYISGYHENQTILTVLQDASVPGTDGKEELQLTYRFFKPQDSLGNSEYTFAIYMGDDPTRRYTFNERKYFNVQVIKALRDVEGDMKSGKYSPLKKLIKEYSIDNSKLQSIAEEYQRSSAEILDLDELKDLTGNINKKMGEILGTQEYDVSLQAVEIDPSKVLSSLKLLMANRSVGDTSLGLNNILYISLLLQLLQDKTVPTFINVNEFNELLTRDNGTLLFSCYENIESGNYIKKQDLTESQEKELYTFFDVNRPTNKGVTILIIEEPEAHLHPVYQRLIYKDVIVNNQNSVLLTTHSTHITSIAPIKSIVNLHKRNRNETLINSTALMPMDDGEFLDVERYLDVKRGEIYFGKGVILVEGIAEEYLLSKFSESMGKSLDEKGVIVCNINSTNFGPYIKLLEYLQIPYAVITDGDFYYESDDEKRVYHIAADNPEVNGRKTGYLGIEVVKRAVLVSGLREEQDIPSGMIDAKNFYRNDGIFIGNNTLEVDMMIASKDVPEAKQVFIDVFNSITDGGTVQKRHFKDEIDNENFWKCLDKIESKGVGKGRFAQVFSQKVMEEHVPGYIKAAIEYIFEKVGN